jgi:hypothetical protein
MAGRSTRALGSMRTTRIVALLALCLAVYACATFPPQADELCGELATYANTRPGGTPRVVRLMTDWGGFYLKSDNPAEELMFAKSCYHGSDDASKALCAYLMANTSTEFASTNYRRALRCLGIHARGVSPSDDAELPHSARSHRVLGWRIDAELIVEFSNATDAEPPTMTISVNGSS